MTFYELRVFDFLSRSATNEGWALLPLLRQLCDGDVKYMFWACDVLRNAGRTDELRLYARDMAAACVGAEATFPRLMRVARFLEECEDWKSAKDVVERAAPLAARRSQRENLAFARLRLAIAADGATPERLGELRRFASSAIMNTNRRKAAEMLEKYAH